MLFARTLREPRQRLFRALTLAQLLFISVLTVSVFAVSCITESGPLQTSALQCKAPTLNDLAALPSSVLLETDLPRVAALPFVFIAFFPFAFTALTFFRARTTAFYKQRTRRLFWLWGRCAPFLSGDNTFFSLFFSRSDALLLRSVS